jgi:diguanylate cyclase (GGDEF)-like protein
MMIPAPPAGMSFHSHIHGMRHTGLRCLAECDSIMQMVPPLKAQSMLSADTVPFIQSEPDVPIKPTQDMHNLTLQLTDLMEKIKTGSAGDIVQQLQVALATLNAISTHDSLTGALNRRGLVQRLESELDRAKRTGHPFSFAVIGIDNFDALNRQYGDKIGDQILKGLAQAALKLLRSLDSVGCVGTNEFAIVLPTTWLDQSDKAIARLTGAVSAVGWSDIAPSLTVTFSTGLTTNAHGDSAEDMINRAGEALSQAKLQGPGSIVQLEQAIPDFDPDL